MMYCAVHSSSTFKTFVTPIKEVKDRLIKSSFWWFQAKVLYEGEPIDVPYSAKPTTYQPVVLEYPAAPHPPPAVAAPVNYAPIAPAAPVVLTTSKPKTAPLVQAAPAALPLIEDNGEWNAIW